LRCSYHSWTGASPEPQTATEAAAHVQEDEASLSSSQQAALQAALQQNGRRLAQAAAPVGAADLATAAASDQTGAASAQHLAAVHSTNQNYEAQKQAMANSYAAQQQVLQQQLLATPAGPAHDQIQQQIASDAAAYTSQQASLKAQTKSQNMNAQAWVGNVDWAAVPWPSQQ
jgi:hypothetical protein